MDLLVFQIVNDFTGSTKAQYKIKVGYFACCIRIDKSTLVKSMNKNKLEGILIV